MPESSVIAPASGWRRSRSDARGTLRRAVSYVVQNRCKIGERGNRITQPHRPCLAHTACTCASVADSPRLTGALERAIASRSSGERTTGAARSAPASCMMVRAMSSRSSDGRRRTASTSSSRRFVAATKIQADCVESHFPYCRAEVDFSRFFLIRGATGLAIYGTNATTRNFYTAGKNK
jgi:hypothetical protein